METFANTVQLFLNELSHFTGNPAKFSIDYKREELIITDAASGFLRQLLLNDRWLVHLSEKGASVSRFADK